MRVSCSQPGGQHRSQRLARGGRSVDTRCRDEPSWWQLGVAGAVPSSRLDGAGITDSKCWKEHLIQPFPASLPLWLGKVEAGPGTANWRLTRWQAASDAGPCVSCTGLTILPAKGNTGPVPTGTAGSWQWRRGEQSLPRPLTLASRPHCRLLNYLIVTRL